MSTRKKITKLIVSLSLVGLVLLASAGPAAALKPHVRDGWLVGISYGYSQGHIDWEGDAQGSYEGGAVPQIRFARMLDRKLALGFEYHGWMLEEGGIFTLDDGVLPLKVRSSLQSVTLAATWYPGEPESFLEGLYLRGGVGYGWAGFTIVIMSPDPEEHVPIEQEHGIREDESGIGYNFAIGYEFRLSRSMAAGMSLGLDYLAINEAIYESSYYFPLTLSAAWYWD